MTTEVEFLCSDHEPLEPTGDVSGAYRTASLTQEVFIDRETFTVNEGDQWTKPSVSWSRAKPSSARSKPWRPSSRPEPSNGCRRGSSCKYVDAA